jgi:ATP synthase protein I
MPESKDVLPSLDTLQRKIDEAKSRTDSRKPEESPEGSQNGIGQGMRMGLELVSGVAVGSVFGYVIDRWLGTMPLFFIVCFFLGAAAGFRNMVREAGRNADDNGSNAKD